MSFRLRASLRWLFRHATLPTVKSPARRLGFECLEGQALPTALPPGVPTVGPHGGEYVVIDELTIPLNSEGKVPSTAVLAKDQTYLAIAVGGAKIAKESSGTADAEYIRYDGSTTAGNAQDNSSPGVTPKTNMGIRLSGVKLASTGAEGDALGNFWGDYNPNHTYYQPISGEGKSISGFYRDVPKLYGDNSGYVKVMLAQEIGGGDINAIQTEGAKGKSKTGWVSVNNDNDNYNFDQAEDQKTSTKERLDKDEDGPVDGENDLIELDVDAVKGAVAGDKISLQFAGGNFKLWKTSDKDGAVLSGQTTFDATESRKVWAEGIKLDGLNKSAPVTVQWASKDTKITKKLGSVSLFVYDVSGSRYVPGFSKYTYTASVPGTIAAMWQAIDGSTSLMVGATSSGTSTDPNAGPMKKNSADILWNCSFRDFLSLSCCPAP